MYVWVHQYTNVLSTPVTIESLTKFFSPRVTLFKFFITYNTLLFIVNFVLA